MSNDEGDRIRLKLDDFIVQMRRDGLEYGRRVRQAQGKPSMPETVREGSTKKSELTKAAELNVWRICEMWRLGLLVPDASAYAGRKAFTLSQFFDRT